MIHRFVCIHTKFWTTGRSFRRWREIEGGNASFLPSFLHHHNRGARDAAENERERETIERARRDTILVVAHGHTMSSSDNGPLVPLYGAEQPRTTAACVVDDGGDVEIGKVEGEGAQLIAAGRSGSGGGGGGGGGRKKGSEESVTRRYLIATLAALAVCACLISGNSGALPSPLLCFPAHFFYFYFLFFMFVLFKRIPCFIVV